MIADNENKNKERHYFDNDEIQLLKFAALYGKDITDNKKSGKSYEVYERCNFKWTSI
mgnify:CR=1 FL=1